MFRQPPTVSIGFFIITGIAIVYNGGDSSHILFLLLVAISITAASLGTAAWIPAKSRVGLPTTRHRWQMLFPAAITTYLLALIAATVISIVPAISLELALAMAMLPFGYAIVTAALRSGTNWCDIWASVRVVGLVLAGLAIIERSLTGERTYATLTDPNALSGVLNVFVITEFFATAAAARHNRLRIRNVLSVGVFALATGTTGSLSGLLCLAIMLLTSSVILFFKLGKIRQRLLVILIVIIIMALALAGAHGGKDDPNVKLQSLASHSSFTVRLEMARAALKIYREHAWHGTGLGTFILYYPEYRGPLDTGSSGNLAHNDYAQFLQEGGPLLLGALLLLGIITLLGLFDSLKRTDGSGGHAVPDLEKIGAGLALVAILMQAAMNFVFYVVTLSFLFGILFARLAFQPLASQPLPLPSRGQKLVFTMIVTAGSILLGGIMGTRGLFVLLTVPDRCELHACPPLRSDLAFMNKLTAFLTGTQPTWIMARSFVINDLLKGVATTSDERHSAELRTSVTKELVQLIQDVPVLGRSYVNLADLIEIDPILTSLLPPTLPHDAAGLYRMALERTPQDLGIRLGLVNVLLRTKREEEAYDVLFKQGMHYWDMSTWGEVGRMRFLTNAIPLAAQLHHCFDAHEMAEGLKVFVRERQDVTAAGKPMPAAPQDTVPASNAEVMQALAASDACK